MDRYEATTALPYEHHERATAGHRAQLRLQAIEHGVTPDWSTFEVSDLTSARDGLGRPWFEYRATVRLTAAVTVPS